MQVIVTLACTKCKNRNYTTTKNKKSQKRLEVKKFCRFCKKHVVHKEVK
ncbi:50S ribosomal protein L33 [candidate division WOR-3 bacterium]|nr:50S ribosomal protein L33 [candidate division WOR-3 bacterium]